MLKLKIESMTCNHCISLVTKAIKTLDSNASVSVDLAKFQASVQSNLSQDEILAALAEAGYPATLQASCCTVDHSCKVT